MHATVPCHPTIPLCSVVYRLVSRKQDIERHPYCVELAPEELELFFISRPRPSGHVRNGHAATSRGEEWGELFVSSDQGRRWEKEIRKFRCYGFQIPFAWPLLILSDTRSALFILICSFRVSLPQMHMFWIGTQHVPRIPYQHLASDFLQFLVT